ncbi:MAG TPA: ABC transporter permease subunit [Clostridia bacterium]|nr:ABC transporter permease subunit [Clostridia bacterium]
MAKNKKWTKEYLVNNFKQNKFMYLMLLPVVAYYLIIHYWSMGWLSISFFDYKLLKGFAGSKFVGLANFDKFVKGLNFGNVIGNTLLLNFYSLVFYFPMPIIFALLLNELKNLKFKKFVQTVSYMPHFLSAVVLVSIMNVMLSPSTGFLNGFLKSLGFDSIYFMGDAKWFRTVYVASVIWQETGWAAITYISTLSGIDQGLYEAAKMDGAGKLRQIWHISLPGIRETIILLLIMRVGNMINLTFEKPYLMQNALNTSVSEVLSTYTYKIGIVNGSYSQATAIGLFSSLVSLVFVLGANFLSNKVAETSLF